MASLDELLKIDGVAAAGEFGKDGRLVDYKANMDMSRDMAERVRSSARRSRCCSTR